MTKSKYLQRGKAHLLLLYLAVSLILFSAISACKVSTKSVMDPSQAASIDDGMKSIKYPRKQLPLELSDRVSAWREIVAESLKSTDLSLFGASDCVAFTQLWLEKMNSEYGIKLFYSESHGMGQIKLLSGKETKHDINHAFASDRGLCQTSGDCDKEIIIDASYLQFVENGSCLVEPKSDACKTFRFHDALPKILVGSQAEVAQFYTNLPLKIRLQEIFEDKAFGDWAPESIAPLIYSFGSNSKLRSNLDVFN